MVGQKTEIPRGSTTPILRVEQRWQGLERLAHRLFEHLQQWVPSVPFELRLLLARDAAALTWWGSSSCRRPTSS
jgi:hypothetical protein